MKTLYSAYYEADGYPFASIAEKVESVIDPSDITEKDSAMILWGGSDIDPAFYGHAESKTTYPGGRRDQAEWALLKRAIEMSIPVIGICRGGQMLCAAAGGFLIQDVKNHAGAGHYVKTFNDEEFAVTSLHHQMMFAPKDVDHRLLAWCETPRSILRYKEGEEIKYEPHYIYQDDKVFTPPEDFKEAEAYYFPKIKGLAIQWHPEMMKPDTASTKFLFDYMTELKWIK